MTQSITIRPLTKADEADWRRLWTGYLTFYKTELPEEIYQTAFNRLLSDETHEYNGLVAEMEGKTVGLAHYLFHRSLWTVENVCYLQDLFADPEFRGKGIGRALIEAVYKKADEAEVTKVYWHTQEFNYQGRMLYDRIGVKTPFIRYDRPR